MLYKIAHFLRDKLGWLWNIIDRVNSLLFSIRYGKRINKLNVNLSHNKVVPEGYDLVVMRDVPTEELVFFSCQPDEAFFYFHPHKFDAKSIKRLQNNKAFLAYVLQYY